MKSGRRIGGLAPSKNNAKHSIDLTKFKKKIK